MKYVYEIEFEDRKNNDLLPFKYIGSKSNARFSNKTIQDKRTNNYYYGSSSWNGYTDIVKNEVNKNTKLLYISSEKTKHNYLLKKERYFHIKNDVVLSNNFFNKRIAADNTNYSTPGYGTYKNIKTGKIIRLKCGNYEDYDGVTKGKSVFKNTIAGAIKMLDVNDIKVLNGGYVGITKNVKLSEAHKSKISNASKGSNNGFYNKTHSLESKNKISDRNKGKKRSQEVKDAMSKIRKGVPKSDEHKRKIGRKNLISLKHPVTLDTVRIDKSLKEKYVKMGYLNAFAIKMMNTPMIICPYCNKESKLEKFMNDKHFNNCKEFK